MEFSLCIVAFLMSSDEIRTSMKHRIILKVLPLLKSVYSFIPWFCWLGNNIYIHLHHLHLAKIPS